MESTALAVLALMKSGRSPAAVRGGLTWIAEQRQAGHWGSTQATILALKALIEGTGMAKGDDRRVIEIALDGRTIKKLDIPPDQADVMQQVDLSAGLKPGAETDNAGNHRHAPVFQLEFRYYVPGAKAPEPQSPLTIDLTYDRNQLNVGDALTATATVTNRQNQVAPMVMLDLPIPPGFAVESDSLQRLIDARQIERYQLTPRQIIVYLRSLEPNRPLTLKYRFKSTVPAVVALPPGASTSITTRRRKERASGRD